MKMIFDEGQLASGTADKSQDIVDAELAGRLVLLVEDNETNRLVMSMQISNLGFTAIIASNGQEALELCGHHTFALILTDCSMPEMDGYQLTSVIRQVESSSGKYTPIVAVTANADDREITRCLDCGMDECIFKPVDMGALQSVIDRWLVKSGSSGICASTSCEPEEAIKFEDGKAYSPVDPDVLHRLMGDDMDMHHRLLQKYRDTSPVLVDSMIKAVEEGDLTSVAMVAHKFKSSSRTIGAGQLADLIQLIENAAEINENEEVIKLASLITEEFDKVVQYINRNSQEIS